MEWLRNCCNDPWGGCSERWELNCGWSTVKTQLRKLTCSDFDWRTVRLIPLKAVAHIQSWPRGLLSRPWLTQTDFKSRDVNAAFSTHLFQVMPFLSRPGLGVCNNYVLHLCHGSCFEQFIAMGCWVRRPNILLLLESILFFLESTHLVFFSLIGQDLGQHLFNSPSPLCWELVSGRKQMMLPYMGIYSGRKQMIFPYMGI